MWYGRRANGGCVETPFPSGDNRVDFGTSATPPPVTMRDIYAGLRREARRIASRHPPPAFYRNYANDLERSCNRLQTDPMIAALHRDVAARIEDDFGHGMRHARQVSIEAGALMIIELSARGDDDTDYIRRRVRAVQAAGLLHDIRRKEAEHAEKGAAAAKSILAAHRFRNTDIADVTGAIRNHEAHKPPVPPDTAEGRLVSDCLYDADKFRRGPDNFTDTVWEMVSFRNIPLDRFITRFPRGMAYVEQIRNTFRTPTGREEGPRFIDAGLAIGTELYRFLLREFGGRWV